MAGCFNCNDSGHLLKNCDKPLNIARAAARKLEYLTKPKTSNAIYLMLVNLCEQLDVDGLKDNDSEDNNDDANIFNNLLDISSEANELDITKGSGDDDLPDSLNDATMDKFEVMSEFLSVSSDPFGGSCIDSAAQRTVIGQRQAKLYAIFANVKIELYKSKRAYRFGNVSHECCGEIPIRIPINSTFFTSEEQ